MSEPKDDREWPLPVMSPFNGPRAVLDYILDGPPLSESERKLLEYVLSPLPWRKKVRP
jgi:hypothetical protein